MYMFVSVYGSEWSKFLTNTVLAIGRSSDIVKLKQTPVLFSLIKCVTKKTH